MMASHKFSMLKYAVLIFLSLATSMALAGPLESLSSLSNSAHTLSSCPSVNQREAHTALNEAALCAQTTGNTHLQKQGLALADIQKKVETNVEDRYFSVLATQHANELVCAAKFADDVQKGHPTSDKLLKNHFRDLRTFKLALNEATDNLSKNPAVSVRACPLSFEDLKKDYSEGVRDQDPNYQACAQVISARAHYNKTLAAISLSEFPSVRTALDKYSISKKDLSDKDLEKLIHSTYKNAKNEILKQADLVRKKALNEGGSAFNRNDRRALLADSRLAEKVLADAGQNSALRAVACSADARYGQGADTLDSDLFVGSLVLSGGMIVKAVGSAAKIATAAHAGRAIGTYSLTTSNIIKLSALGGLHGATIWSDIEKSCGNNTISTKVKTSDNCADAPSISKMDEENCYLAATTAAMQVAPTAAVGGLTAAQNRMAKALRSKELEAKIQARRQIIENRNKDITSQTSPAASTSSGNVTALPSRQEAANGSVTVVKPDSPADAKVTSSNQFAAARAKKEQEQKLAAKELEAEELRAQGVDEYDIHFKQMRDEELANMKAEGLYSTKAPNGTVFEEGSFIKGGNTPFQSKAGDINLLTEQQIKQLERHNPGTVVYNYKTGEELVIGLDDFDKDLLKLKIGGKFSQWGFKASN